MELNSLRRLNLDYELVRLVNYPRAFGEHHDRRWTELNHDLRGAAAHRLARAEIERHALPAPVLDVQLDGGESGGLAVGSDALGLAVVVVLSADGIAGEIA